jgi:hypothetical protein
MNVADSAPRLTDANLMKSPLLFRDMTPLSSRQGDFWVTNIRPTASWITSFLKRRWLPYENTSSKEVVFFSLTIVE